MAAERINGAMVRCEERYPSSGPHSVLLVVVERDASQHRARLDTLHAELFGPGKIDPLAPVQLEVIDRATHDAIQKLIDAGLIAKTTRASRPLFPLEQNPEAAPLSAEEKAQSAAHRDRATRKLKMATVLGNSGFDEEARPALLEAIQALGCMLAVERRLPAPAEVKYVTQPPLSHCWAEALPSLRTFLENGAADWRPVAEQLAKL